MREIKFRCQCTPDSKYAGKWVEGSFVPCDDDCALIVSVNVYNTMIYRVKPETVGQFTGLLDKNGKEIYEGDIIHIKTENFDKDFGVVTWHKDGYFYVDNGFGKFPRDRCKTIGDFVEDIEDISRDFGAEIYVSGNIHDNPELLKKEEK